MVLTMTNDKVHEQLTEKSISASDANELCKSILNAHNVMHENI